MKIARPVNRVIESLQRLPGIGPKTAQRLAYYLLRVPQSELAEFAEALSSLKKETKLCSICKNIAETDPCPICADDKRDTGTILVVEEPLDIIAFERADRFEGVYHVLHGAINPLENIGPEELYIDDLFKRLSNGHPVGEIIIATNPTMEGEATAMYITKHIKAKGLEVVVSRLGMGIPTGADLEYADETTLREALSGRRNL